MLWRQDEGILWYGVTSLSTLGILVYPWDVRIVTRIMVDVAVQRTLPREKVQVREFIADISQSCPDWAMLEILAEEANEVLLSELMLLVVLIGSNFLVSTQSLFYLCRMWRMILMRSHDAVLAVSLAMLDASSPGGDGTRLVRTCSGHYSLAFLPLGDSAVICNVGDCAIRTWQTMSCAVASMSVSLAQHSTSQSRVMVAATSALKSFPRNTILGGFLLDFAIVTCHASPFCAILVS